MYAVQPTLLALSKVCRSSPCVKIRCVVLVQAPRSLLSVNSQRGTWHVTLACSCCFLWGGSKRKTGNHVACCTGGNCKCNVGRTVPLWRRRGGTKRFCRNHVKLSYLTCVKLHTCVCLNMIRVYLKPSE